MTTVLKSTNQIYIAEMGGEKVANTYAALNANNGIGASNSMQNTMTNGECDTSDNNLEFRSESVRLRTFDNWPVSFVNKNDLAAAGFYYLGEKDCVRCPFCSIGLAHWEPGDIPLNEHRKNSPNCTFLLENFDLKSNDECGIYKQNMSSLHSCNANNDDCSIYETNITSPEHTQTQQPCVSNYSKVEPKYPKFELYEERLKTFIGWPYSQIITPEILSSAGFVYTNIADRVYCFHCGVVLHDWAPNDDPWEDHAMWGSNCDFVIKNKGQQFIDEIKKKRKNSLATTREVMENALETIRQMVTETDITK